MSKIAGNIILDKLRERERQKEKDREKITLNPTFITQVKILSRNPNWTPMSSHHDYHIFIKITCKVHTLNFTYKILWQSNTILLLFFFLLPCLFFFYFNEECKKLWKSSYTTVSSCTGVEPYDRGSLRQTLNGA